MSTTPDPRPRAARRAADATTGTSTGTRLVGASCDACGLHSLSQADRCPSCRSPMRPAEFGPDGTVWSSTVVRIPVPGRTPPYTLAYLDLDDGPRVLCRVEHVDHRVPVGTVLRLSGTTDDGDVAARLVDTIDHVASHEVGS